MNKGILEVRWLAVENCPLCGSSPSETLGRLALHEYVSCGYRIPIAPRNEEPIAIRRCGRCQLIFKSRVPEPEDLRRIYVSAASDAWASSYGYGKELKLVQQLFPQPRSARVLDVGPGQGGFLRAVRSIGATVSALDFVTFANSRQSINGEFIEGLIEDEKLEWSERPYDLVSLFDVLEHVYRADKAFRNIGRLVAPRGYVLIETGNPDSQLPTQFGIPDWWYLGYIEHHCAWSVKAIAWAAGQHGFEVIQTVRCRHKDRAAVVPIKVLATLLRSCIYRASPAFHGTLFSAIGYGSHQPAPPFERDHIQVLLRRSR